MLKLVSQGRLLVIDFSGVLFYSASRKKKVESEVGGIFGIRREIQQKEA